MNAPQATQAPTSYELSSELARLGLHAAEADADRKLAWVNSIGILILLIGVVGSKPASIKLKPPPPIEEATTAIVEPLPPPPVQTQAIAQEQDQTDEAQPDAPQVVVVTLSAPNIVFSVPTIGNVLVPNAMAQPPPIHPLKQVTPLRSLPTVLNTTGRGGDRPEPPYPIIAREQGQQGSVTLRMSVDDSGSIKTVEIAQSSGSGVLDRSALDFVKRHWMVPPAAGTRFYEATITYRLQ